MKILGIHASHDAGAAIIEDGRVLCCVNEERLNRQKQFWGIPSLSIKEVLRISGTRPEEIGYVAIASITNGGGIQKDFEKASRIKRLADILSYSSIFRSHFAKNVYRSVSSFFRDIKDLEKCLDDLEIRAPIKLVEHHECHAASAYYCSQFAVENDVLVVTLDSAGDGLCSTVSVIEDKKIKRLHETTFPHSPGAIYSYVTHNFGFKYGRHEGKITGLAAYGDSQKTISIFRKIIHYDKKKLEFRCDLGCWGRLGAAKLNLLLKDHKREDIAAGVQKVLEEAVSGLVGEACRRYKKKFVCLAGGVFANVRVNQTIFELPEVEDIFVHQHMGDGGIGLGAALSLWADLDENPNPICLENACLGTNFSNDEIKLVLEEKEIHYDYFEDVHQKIAQLLSEGKIIGRFVGPMEYGPRALGNRSILYQTSDKSVNVWLNEKLRRTEFMPFAPIVLREKAGDYFKNFAQNRSHAANFMTITYDVTDKCKQDSPAITHVDGTARPQIVDQENNFDSWQILRQYYKITGKPIVINTSFNMHEEPIVCTPSEAVESFLESNLDVLAIGNYIIHSPYSESDLKK